jgi:hypothetical protein
MAKTKKMKKYLFAIVLLIAFLNPAHAQTNPNLVDFNKSRNHKTTAGLKVLGGWALANIAASGYFYYHTTGSDKYFNQMNVMWNSANVLIVAASLLPKQKNDLDLTKTLQWQSNTEATYIASAALDLLYSSVGLYLTEKAKNDLEHRDKFNGFGNSLIMQGGFLFLFDTSMFIIHKKNGKKLYKMMDNVTVSTSGLGLRIGIHL